MEFNSKINSFQLNSNSIQQKFYILDKSLALVQHENILLDNNLIFAIFPTEILCPFVYCVTKIRSYFHRFKRNSCC